MDKVFSFIYSIKDDKLVLTRIHWTTDNHLIMSLIEFEYYTIEEKKYEDCICFINHLCSQDRHYNTYKSTEGYTNGYCTFYTLYNCVFKNCQYDKLYICSDCSVLMINNKLYSLYVDDVPNVDNILYDCLQDKVCPDVMENIVKHTTFIPKYKPCALYEHVFYGDEPGYHNDCGILDLEKISYKMGVEIMCKLHQLKKDNVFDYTFDYKTSLVQIEDENLEFKLYLHLGKFLCIDSCTCSKHNN